MNEVINPPSVAVHDNWDMELSGYLLSDAHAYESFENKRPLFRNETSYESVFGAFSVLLGAPILTDKLATDAQYSAKWRDTYSLEFAPIREIVSDIQMLTDGSFFRNYTHENESKLCYGDLPVTASKKIDKEGSKLTYDAFGRDFLTGMPLSAVWARALYARNDGPLRPY